MSKDQLEVLKKTIRYLLIPLLCAAVAWSRGQDINWDIQNYHLYNAYALLNDRQALDLAPAGLQTWFNPLLDTFWYLLLQVFPPAVVGAFAGFLHGLNFVLVYRIAAYSLPAVRWHGDIAWGLGLAGILSVGFRSELGNSMQDDLVPLFILGALLLVLRAQQRIQFLSAWRTLAFAGLMAGVACALKLVVSLYALGLCFAILVLPRDWLDRFIGAAIYGVGVCAGLLAVGGYWFWKNWLILGNPIFPQFNAYFEGKLANNEVIRDVRFLPQSAWEYLVYPFVMTFNPGRVSEIHYNQYSWMTIYILLVVVGSYLLIKRVRGSTGETVGESGNTLPLTAPGRLVLWFFCFSYLLWLHLFGIYRYLIPIELLLPLVLVIASSLPAKQTLIPGISLVVILTLINMPGAPDWGHSDWNEEIVSMELPSDSSQVGTVLLMGAPLGWLVPALDLPIPFLQIDPNFPTAESLYMAALLERIGQSAAIRVIFDPQVYASSAVSQRITEMGYTMVAAECQLMVAYFGSQPFNYQYCPVLKDA